MDQNDDFIICRPGLQKRVTASTEPLPVIYLESLEYQKPSVDLIMSRIKEKL